MKCANAFILSTMLGAAAVQAQGLEYLLPAGNSRILFSTHTHTMKDGSRPAGLFDGLVWIPKGAYNEPDGYIFMNHEQGFADTPQGSVSRLSYQDGTITEAETWVSGLSRPCSSHDSPWGTVLVAEEDDSAKNGEYGYIVEIDPTDKSNTQRRVAMGRAGWENVVAHPLTMEFFLTDDSRPTSNKGAFYRFVPDRLGDLSSGRLFAFRAEGGSLAERSPGTWIEIINPDQAQQEAFEKGATLYDRPEDLAYNPVDGWLYINMTGDSRAAEAANKAGGIYRFDPVANVMERWLVADANPIDSADNIEIDPNGNLWIAEDGVGPNELILVRPDKSTQVVMRGTETNGEVTGVLWRPDGKGFWVHWQHGKDPNGVIAAGAEYDELYEVTLPTEFQALKPWIYAVDSPTAVSAIEAAALPQALGLSQNYPNPFNPETAIRFEVPAAAEVELAVYNATGQKVATLISRQPMQAGTYQATWDGRDQQGQRVGTGAYLYRLQAGDRVETRQMTLLK